MNEVLCRAVSVIVVNWSNRTIDWDLLKVRAAMSIYLRIEVGEDATLKQRVFCEVDTAYDVAWLELITI